MQLGLQISQRNLQYQVAAHFRICGGLDMVRTVLPAALILAAGENV